MLTSLGFVILLGTYLLHIGYTNGTNNAYLKTSECHNILLRLEAEGYCRLRHSSMDYKEYLQHCDWMRSIEDNKTDEYAREPECKFPSELK